jgi:hypothetical protein
VKKRGRSHGSTGANGTESLSRRRMSHDQPCRSPPPCRTTGFGIPRRVVLLLIALKLYILLILYALFLRTDLRNGDKGFFFLPGGQAPAERSAAIQASFWERLAPYDGQWYLDIASNGYRSFGPPEARASREPPGNYAFFPLLPATLKGFQRLAGESYLPATLLLNIALSALGAALVWALARDLGAPPWLSTALLIAFPTAAFQFALYTEGVFLLFSALCLLALHRRKLPLAIFAAALAGLTRPQGVLLALPCFIELVLPVLRSREAVPRLGLALRGLAVIAPFSGFLVLAAISLSVAESPWAFLEIQSRWGRSFDLSNIRVAIESAFGYGGPRADLLGLGLGVLLLPVIWRRLPLSLALYGTVMLLLPLATGSLLSLGRFLSVSVPHFLALGLLLERTPLLLRGGVVALFATGQLFVASGLIAWHLVG